MKQFKSDTSVLEECESNTRWMASTAGTFQVWQRGSRGEKERSCRPHLSVRCVDSPVYVILTLTHVCPAGLACILVCQKLPFIPPSFHSPSLCALIPGEHVCWNSLPIKTGISGVHCGNKPECGKAEGLSPSPSLPLTFSAPPPSASFSRSPSYPPCHSHPLCSLTLTAILPPLFSPYILLFLFTLTLSSLWHCVFYLLIRFS